MEQEIKSEMGQEYLKEQVEALQKERDSLKVQNENLEKRLEEQNVLLRKIFKDAGTTNVTEISKVVLKLQSEVANKETKAKAWKEKAKVLESEKSEIVARNDELNSQIFSLKLDRALESIKLEDVTAKLESSQKEIAVLQENLEAYKTTLTMKAEENEELLKKWKKAEENHKNMIEEVESVQLENSEVRELLESSEKYVKDQIREITNLQSQIVQSKLESQEKSVKISEMEDKLKSSKTSEEASKRKVSDLETKLQLLNSQKSLMETQILKEKDKMERLRKFIESINGSTAPNFSTLDSTGFHDASTSFVSEDSKADRKRKQTMKNTPNKNKLFRTSSNIRGVPTESMNFSGSLSSIEESPENPKKN